MHQFLKVLLITLIIGCTLSCTKVSEKSTLSLPEGFDFADTFLHEANLGLYLGANAHLNTFLGIEDNISVEGVEILGHSFSKDVAVRAKIKEISKVSIDSVKKGTLPNLLGEHIKISEVGEYVALINDKSHWSKDVENYWASPKLENRKMPSDLQDHIGYLPHKTSLEMQAVGYVRNANNLASTLLPFDGNVAIEIDPVLDFLRAKIVIVALYGEVDTIYWDQLKEKQNFSGIVAVTRSGYPGIITRFVCSRFFNALSFEEQEIDGHTWHTLEAEENTLMMVKCDGNMIYLIFPSTAENGRILSNALDLGR